MEKLVEKALTEKRDPYQDVTNRMVLALEAGVIPWRKMWRGGSANAPRNGVTGKHYRGINILILSLEQMTRGFSSSRWITFKQAMARKGKFRGEKGDDIRKGVVVVLWKPMVKPMLDANQQPIIENGKVKQRVFMFMRTFTVFNEEQFDGLKLPVEDTNAASEPTPIEAAEAIWNGYQNRPKIKFGYDHACWYPSSDVIEMPEMGQFVSTDAYYAALFHEAGHSTGHTTRLDRDTVNGFTHFGDSLYSQEELIAEMSSAFLCAHAGIESTFDNSASYLASWLKVLKEDNKAIIYAAARAQKAADHILGIKYDEKKEENDA